ncbi:MAG TPA: peroxiredoxin [Planktothrix sp.]|jgi:peroxiredoxin Q/BCP
MKLLYKAGLAASVVLLTAAVAGANETETEKTSSVKVGDKAPDFSLPDQDGKMHSLKEFAGKKTVVLYFYPKDDMGVCLKEACLFRDSYAKFTNAGAAVIGVSDDSVESHKKFIKHRNLPFTLLSDKSGKVRTLYGVPMVLDDILPDRETFVIDRQGTVRLTYTDLMDADGHVGKALDALKKINEKQSATAR